MDNALGEPQTIVLLGATSDIGRAIVERLLSPSTRTVVLAGRRPAEARTVELERPGLTVEAVHFDATDGAAHDVLVRDLAAAFGDLDVVIVAFGQLVDQAELDDDPARAADLVTVNFTGAVSVSLAVAAQFRRQGHGHLVVLSSVAGERVRKANFVYGASKAGPRRLRPGPRRRPRRFRRQRARRPPRVRALPDDRGHGGRPVRHHPGRRRRRHRQGAGQGPPHGVGAGHAAPGLQRLPPPPRQRVATPPTQLIHPRVSLHRVFRAGATRTKPSDGGRRDR